MPAYDYDCANCGTRFEVVHGVHADPPTTCPVCASDRIRKAISAPTIHYKGSGWAKKERRATASPSSSRPAADGSTVESGSSDGGSGDGGSADAGSGGEKSASDKPSKQAKATTPTEAATASSTD